jgi:hypothetical protein
MTASQPVAGSILVHLQYLHSDAENSRNVWLKGAGLGFGLSRYASFDPTGQVISIVIVIDCSVETREVLRM